MILCDSEILVALNSGQLVIEPRPPNDHITTTAIDLTLGNEFMRWHRPAGKAVELTIDPSQPDFLTDCAELSQAVPADPDGSVVIEPGMFILVMTQERVFLPITSRLA